MGLIFFSGAKVAPRFPYAGTGSVPPFAAPQATSALVKPPAVRPHVAKAKTAVAPIYLHDLADPVGDPLDFDVGRFE